MLLALPVINRGLHHYMKFGLELGLALLAAAGCDRWLAGKGRGLLAGAGLVLGLLAVAWVWFGGDLPRPTASPAREAAWTACDRGSWWSSWRSRCRLPAEPALDPLAPPARPAPGRPRRRPLPHQSRALRTPGSTRSPAPSASSRGSRSGWPEIGEALHPDAAMVYGLYDVRGDSPVKLQRYEEVYGEMGRADPVYFYPIERWSSPWLDRLGVRWVLSGPSEEAPPGLGWKLAYAGRDARVWERPGAIPLARLEGRGSGGARIERRLPGEWRVAWNSPVPDRLVIAETWDPGWRATVDGRPVAIEPRDGILMTVPLPAGSGSAELRYHPAGFTLGMMLSLLGLRVLAAGATLARR